MNRFWFICLLFASSATLSESMRERDNRKLEVVWELTGESWVKFGCLTVNLSSVAKFHSLEFNGIHLVGKPNTDGVSYIPLDTHEKDGKYYARPCLSLGALEDTSFLFMYKTRGSKGSTAHGVVDGKDLSAKAKELASFYTSLNK